MSGNLPAGVFILANEQAINTLRENPLVRDFEASTFVPLAANAQVPGRVLAQARVLVIEVDPASPLSLNRISDVRKGRPSLPIIAAIDQADVSLTRTLIRQGVYDVAVLPFAPDELVAQVFDAAASMTSQEDDLDLAPLISVVRSAGGCGTTTILTHLAAALAERDTSGRGICIVDLDLQNGEIAPFVNKAPNVSISALLEAGERIDSELLGSAITETEHGFSIISAPNEISPIEDVQIDQVLKILELVRKRFGIVLIDLPASWTNWSLSTALSSTELLLVTDLTVGSLRQAKRRLNLFAYFDILPKQVKVVVNKSERKLFKAIGVHEVHETLRSDVVAILADEGATMRSAQDQGLLITDLVRKSKFGADIAHLAEFLLESGD